MAVQANDEQREPTQGAMSIALKLSLIVICPSLQVHVQQISAC